MTLDATVRARVDGQLKEEVEIIFKELGLTTSQAINLFLNSVRREHGIPFELKIPNETTFKAMQEAKEMDGEVSTLDELLTETKTGA